jgi:hypothetical protein
MKAKTKAQGTPGAIAEAVAKGEADLSVFLINVIDDPRLDAVGPFPGGIQRHVVYEAAEAAKTAKAEAAAAFITHLLSPAAARIIKSRGMEPGEAGQIVPTSRRRPRAWTASWGEIRRPNPPRLLYAQMRTCSVAPGTGEMGQITNPLAREGATRIGAGACRTVGANQLRCRG